MLGGRGVDEVLPTLQVVHEVERHFAWMFTTLCMVTIAPDRRSVRIRLAGHPPPLLIAGRGIEPLEPSRRSARRSASSTTREWVAAEHPLPDDWALLLYTDGLIEGRTGVGTARLGGEGLEAMVRGELETGSPGLVTTLVERAEELNGGPLLDDVAALLVQRR